MFRFLACQNATKKIHWPFWPGGFHVVWLYFTPSNQQNQSASVNLWSTSDDVITLHINTVCTGSCVDFWLAKMSKKKFHSPFWPGGVHVVWLYFTPRNQQNKTATVNRQLVVNLPMMPSHCNLLQGQYFRTPTSQNFT